MGRRGGGGGGGGGEEPSSLASFINRRIGALYGKYTSNEGKIIF